MKSYYSLENLVVELINLLKLYETMHYAIGLHALTTTPLHNLLLSRNYFGTRCLIIFISDMRKLKNMRFDIQTYVLS